MESIHIWIHAVWIGSAPPEFRCLSLQHNFGTSQGIFTDNAVEDFWVDDKTPCHAPPIITEKLEEAADIVLFEDGNKVGNFVLQSLTHPLY